MTDKFDKLKHRFNKFQAISAQARAMNERFAEQYVHRCESDIARVLNSFILSMLEWADKAGHSIDDKPLSDLDDNTLAGRFEVFKVVAVEAYGSPSIHLQLLMTRCETSLTQLLTDYFLNCYDMIMMLGGKEEDLEEDDVA